jgi:hypothetical protein
MKRILPILALFAAASSAVAEAPEPGASLTLPYYLQDRGPGMTTSLFGSYVKEKELVLYAFYEYTYHGREDYNPKDFGFGLDKDCQGRLHESEELLFLGYGINDWLMVEGEIAYIQSSLSRAKDDLSGMPQTVRQKGPDFETQVRCRFLRETEGAPEVYGFFETDWPLQRSRALIGTTDWIFGLGAGVVKGFTWGTLSLRAQVEYTREDGNLRMDEIEIEYLKKLSDSFRILVAVEEVAWGTEVELVTELQWQLTPSMYLKLNNAVGLTPDAPTWAPEVGLMMSF